MGAVSRDIYKKEREYDGEYAYNEPGIANMLKDIYDLSEKRWYRGDIDATTIINDLKMALDSDCLTPRMRQIVALYYFAELTEEDTADILDIAQQTVNEILKSAIYRVSNEMEKGDKVRNSNKLVTYEASDGIFIWLNLVAYKKFPVYIVPNEVVTELLKLKEYTDECSAETLRQRKFGYTVYEDVNIPEYEKYPFLTSEQMSWKDRRVTYVPLVYPPRTITGNAKVAIKIRDGDVFGNEWKLEKRKFFKEKF